MRRLIALVVILAVLGFGTSKTMDWWNFNVNTPISTSSHTVPFNVDQGETPTDIGTNLFDLHLIRSTVAFDLYTRLTNAGPSFEAGSFVLNSNMSLAQIVSALQHSNPTEQVITFPEGFPLREQAKTVEAKKLGAAPNFFTAADYLQAAKDPSWAASYGFLPRQPASADFPYEGYLFPDTYQIDPAAGVRGLVKEQLDQFGVVFSSDLQAQIAQATPNRPAETVQAIVILASMVDREANANNPSDRGNVCSVYYNRLKIGMPLGVDATLLYALGRLSPEPTAAELTLNSPYNTRTHAGLPPGPISNPGQAALLACINPPKTNYLFYFADRQGVTHFETNQSDFDRDIQKYGVSGS
ncbi:MAG TPA: endolytic transglycosylase MltG [Candidatus Dormibacteraeota bacterium]|nr:endolytic transglycosylase MltG [Candidatus Dormibacteraeota bacterium]